MCVSVLLKDPEVQSTKSTIVICIFSYIVICIFLFDVLGVFKARGALNAVSV